MKDPYSENPAKDAKDQELAQYIADMLLELRKMAKGGGLNTLLRPSRLPIRWRFPPAKLKSSGVW